MDDDRWPETEHGTVVRRYFHARGAARELAAAQDNGWEVQEATLNGKPVPENPRRKWLRLPPTRLERDANGRVRLRSNGAGGGWHTHGGLSAFDLEITYVRS